METEVFLDTAYAIALASIKDQHHAKAVHIARELAAQKTHLITTRAVMLEIGNALGQLKYRAAAVQLLDALEADPSVGIVPLTENLFAEAIDLYKTRPDKEWGLVDCVSFVVMREREIISALTSDHHFQQAGFQVLLSD